MEFIKMRFLAIILIGIVATMGLTPAFATLPVATNVYGQEIPDNNQLLITWDYPDMNLVNGFIVLIGGSTDDSQIPPRHQPFYELTNSTSLTMDLAQNFNQYDHIDITIIADGKSRESSTSQPHFMIICGLGTDYYPTC